MSKRYLLGVVAGALAAGVLASGIAAHVFPGTGGVINGCYKKNEGPASRDRPRSDHCRPSEVAIVWNEQGVKGDKGDKGGDPGSRARTACDGSSVTVEPEAAGANCPAGGAKLTAANGVAYVCSARCRLIPARTGRRRIPARTSSRNRAATTRVLPRRSRRRKGLS